MNKYMLKMKVIHLFALLSKEVLICIIIQNEEIMKLLHLKLLKKVNKALENVFNFVKQDGGELKIIDLTDDMVLQVELNGACRTCDMNTMTFKAGVEETILKSIPEIKSVEALNFSFE